MTIDSTTAIVAAVHRGRYNCLTSDGERLAQLSPLAAAELVSYPTVGDRVTLEQNPDGDSRICAVAPRKTYFMRADPDPTMPREQAVAANFDHVLIVQSMNQNFSIKRLERYLVAAWQSGATPVVALTKMDLCDRPGDFTADAIEAAQGCEVHAVSALTGEGMEGLQPYVSEGKMAVLLGSSGVGKSTLVNALAGSELMLTREIREDDARGRHTTTHRQLLALPSGGWIIDTPGMRTLGLWDAAAALENVFPDVEAVLARGCRFADCQHRTEPDCAVRVALRTGELDAERWVRYQKLLKESAHTARKARLREKREGRPQPKPNRRADFD